LTSIRGLYRYAARRHPEHAAAIERVLAIPLNGTSAGHAGRQGREARNFSDRG
jgi:hypothetical protein